MVASQARLEGIIDSAMDAIISVDGEQRVILFNSAAVKMFGYPGDQVIGQPLSMLLPERYRQAHEEHVHQFAETGETNRDMDKLGKLYGRRADGSDFPVEASISRAGSGKGQVLTVILRDITERVAAEEALLEKEQKLSQALAENVRLYNQAETNLQFLTSLRTIDLAISSTVDLRIILNILLDQVETQLKADATAILLNEPSTQHLEFVAGRGFLTNLLNNAQGEIDRGCADEAAHERRTAQNERLEITDLVSISDNFLRSEKIESCFAAPLIVKGHLIGVLVVFRRRPYSPEKVWIGRLEALAGQAAIAIDSAQLFENLQRSNQQLMQAYNATIEGWSHALDLRDHETEGHTQRVTDMTLKLAEFTGKFAEDELLYIRWGALLHDIGKMGVPDEILLKPDKLDPLERDVMRHHPEIAYQLLQPIAFLRRSLDIPRYHHERWDGLGYPFGLSGDTIPLPARLFSVVDVWDALRFGRPYRAGWEEERVATYLADGAGTQFDPDAVNSFLKVLQLGAQP